MDPAVLRRCELKAGTATPFATAGDGGVQFFPCRVRQRESERTVASNDRMKRARPIKTTDKRAAHRDGSRHLFQPTTVFAERWGEASPPSRTRNTPSLRSLRFLREMTLSDTTNAQRLPGHFVSYHPLMSQNCALKIAGFLSLEY